MYTAPAFREGEGEYEGGGDGEGGGGGEGKGVCVCVLLLWWWWCVCVFVCLCVVRVQLSRDNQRILAWRGCCTTPAVFISSEKGRRTKEEGLRSKGTLMKSRPCVRRTQAKVTHESTACDPQK